MDISTFFLHDLPHTSLGSHEYFLLYLQPKQLLNAVVVPFSPLNRPLLYSPELQTPSFPSFLPHEMLFQAEQTTKPGGGLCSRRHTVQAMGLLSGFTPRLSSGSPSVMLPPGSRLCGTCHCNYFFHGASSCFPLFFPLSGPHGRHGTLAFPTSSPRSQTALFPLHLDLALPSLFV